MKTFRFSLALLMAVVASCGVGIASLRSPSQLWASTLFTVTLGILTLASVNVIYSRERHRAFWVGFSICGGVYFVLGLGPWLGEAVGMRLVTTALLDITYPAVVPQPPQAAAVGMSAMTVGSGMAGGEMSMTWGRSLAAPEPSRWPVWSEPDRYFPRTQVGQISLSSPEPYRRIGHSLLTLLIAALGGYYARYCYDQLGDVPRDA